MANNILKDRFLELEKLAYGAGLRPYDVHFFEVPVSVIYEVASYGLPTRYSHWSFGRTYSDVRTHGEMGFSKIYELILNNDPSFAFLDKNNPDTINLLVAAHCQGHSDFFKNNIMFRQCGQTDMIDRAKHHAQQIDSFRRDHGDDEVDEWLDVALALERHIDVHSGLHREKYPPRHVEFKERVKKDWEDVAGKEKSLINRVIEGVYLPPQPEKDLLWFFSVYSNLESWQQRIFEIVREESYYFYPQFRTKIMNEGWASYWHAELMRQYSFGDYNDYGVKGLKYPLTAEEHLDFVAAHEKVVQPGVKINLKMNLPDIDPRTGKHIGTVRKFRPNYERYFAQATRLNPYYVGFRIYRDIKERWDKYYEQGHMEDEWGEKIPVTINGDQKIREVMEDNDDVSFLRNYLTEELADDLHLFVYGNTEKYKDDYTLQDTISSRDEQLEDSELGARDIDKQIIENRTIAVRSKNLEDIIAAMAKTRNNYGVPLIYIRRVDEMGTLRLEHAPEDSVNIDIKYAQQVVMYVHKIWGRTVELIRKSPPGGENRTYILRYNGHGPVQLDWLQSDYPECVESNGKPSSW